MPTPRITTDEQDREILAKEKTDAQLGEEFGLTAQQVLNRRYYLRVRTPLKGKYRPKSKLVGKEQKVKELLRKGWWVSQIAKELGVSVGTVSGSIYRHKLRRKPITRFDNPRVVVQEEMRS
jgi:DNA-binding NarL/FixJ family response regulator